MTRPLQGLLLVAAVAATIPLCAQQLERGDIVLTLVHRDPVEGFPVSNIRIYGRDGAFKRDLITVDHRLTEPFYRDGIIYVGSRPNRIDRIDTAGNLLPPLTTQTVNVNYLSPGPAGGLLATNGSGEIYQLAADGTLLHTRDFGSEIPAEGGIDLARDGCTAYYAASGDLARWDACRHTEPTRFGPSLASAYLAMRLLPDGSFLVATAGLQPNFDNKVMHVDPGGNLIRTYPIPGNALALDVDGTSFWTNAGNNLFHLDIATGKILGVKVLDYIIVGLSIVGEPRAGLAAGADVPAVSPGLLGLLAGALVIVALLRLRTS